MPARSAAVVASVATGARPTRPASWVAIALIAIVSAAAVLRFAGLDRLLPHLREPDAFVAFELQELRNDPAQIEFQNHHLRYPLLIARTLALFPERTRAARIDAELADELELAARPFVEVRVLSALSSILFVAATFLLARRFLAAETALLAAFFVATSLLSILFAQQARPHAVHAALALVAVLCALRARAQPTAVRSVAAGASAALAIGCLQNGIFVIPPLVLALLLGAGGCRERMQRTGTITLCTLLAASTFYASSPYVDATGIHLAPQAGGGHTIPFGFFNALGAWRSARILWYHDPALCLFALLGWLAWMGWLVRHARELPSSMTRDLLVLCAYVVPYSFVVALNGEVYERFLLPLLPYSACLAAFGVTALMRLCTLGVSSSWLRSLIMSALFASAVVFPAWVAAHFASVAMAPDTYEQTSNWIREHVDPSQRILLGPGMTLPLLNDDESLRANLQDGAGRTSPWLVHQRLMQASAPQVPRFALYLLPAQLAAASVYDPVQAASELDRLQPEYVVFEMTAKMQHLPMMQGIMRAVARRATPVFRSHGQVPDAINLGLIQYQDVFRLAARILQTEAFGPEMIVFRIDR